MVKLILETGEKIDLKTLKSGEVRTFFLNLEEVSHLLRCHPNTTRKLALEGQIPALKIGREWRFPSEGITTLGSAENPWTEKLKAQKGENA